MSGDIPERATCEVCGTAFDPSESRGWCPNEACGRWQHPAFPLSEGATAEADGGVDAPTKVCPSCGKDVRADANFCKFCSHEFADEPQQEAPAESEPGLDQCPDCGADLSSIPADRLDDCPICGTNLADVLAEQTEPSVTPADLPACPACGEDLTDIPSDMRMVCPGCRVDLRQAIEDHDIQHPDDVSPPEEPSATADRPEEAQQNVDALKGIGSSYADRLADAGVETVGDLVAADTGELAAMTDISESRIDEWKERASVDPADVGGAGDQGAADQGASAGAGGQAGGQGGQAGQRGGAGQGQTGTGQGQTGAGGQQAGAGGQQAGAGGQQAGQGSQGARGGQAGRGGQQGGQGGRGGQQGGGRQGGQGPQGGQSGGRGGQSGGAGGQAGGGGYGRSARPNYDTVVLEVMGQEIRAQPGDTIGREVRTAMVEGGAPDDDAVYVHREHVRVEREGDSFYLVRLGQNSVKVNGDAVGQHDRAEIGNGDVVSFSEVVTADVRLE